MVGHCNTLTVHASKPCLTHMIILRHAWALETHISDMDHISTVVVGRYYNESYSKQDAIAYLLPAVIRERISPALY